MVKKIFLYIFCSIPFIWGIGYFHFVFKTGDWLIHRNSIYGELFLNIFIHMLQGCYDIFYFTIGWLF